MNQRSTIITLAAASFAVLMMVFIWVFNFASKSTNDKTGMGKLKDVDLNFKDLPDSIDPDLTESSESMPFAKEAFSALKDLLAALA
ncbi:MAG: hypothetical protein VX848_07070, partial [Verrucomicrobiota bacterium]|nr:hypothetical protein [Verrucomicrobiota bacterium]